MKTIMMLVVLALLTPRTAEGSCERCDPDPTAPKYALIFRNHCTYTVHLAVSIPQNGYRTSGWYSLGRGDEIEFEITGRYYYYYADGRNGTWHGKGERHSKKAVIFDRDFDYLDGDDIDKGTSVWFKRRDIGKMETINCTC